MPDWAVLASEASTTSSQFDATAFAGFSLVVLSLLLLLSRATQSAMTDDSGAAGLPTDETEFVTRESPSESPSEPSPGPAPVESSDDQRVPRPSVDGDGQGTDPGLGGDAPTEPRARQSDGESRNPFPPGTPSHETARTDEDDIEFSTGALLVNVAFSQGLLGALLVGAAWYTQIPMSALGVTTAPGNTGWPALLIGVGLGLTLYAANEGTAMLFQRLGFDTDDGLRELLAPDSLTGWVVLLGTVLPVIAVFEELLFRAALIGVISTGFAVSPWTMAVFSTVAFAIGHGMQGPGGIAVTGTLGFVLAAAFIVTGSLFTVVVAHYLVNALEFVVHEGVGVDWT
ncbi:CPBP family intramembrane glutamic endopeptidase [Halostella sp. PRR32]|uniref:CPBP family intramembrane glutamic endopeptidase n=1 Tax=Halostella sp. PRR32 TaxID=3098147 RepID=UPI002B1D3151|nr:CPBP family intramembrane glutamic endopeptidase [Halostella sp. PRR32]